MARLRTCAFTLIELLVVIAIIGILSAVVLSVVSAAREKALEARARQDLKTIIIAIEAARANTGNSLAQITASGCSYCACRVQNNGMESTQCLNNTNLGFVAINNASGGMLAGFIASGTKDPWGSPYLLDENEGENGNWCNKDWIRSAGKDKQTNGANPPGSDTSIDDIVVQIPLAAGRCP